MVVSTGSSELGEDLSCLKKFGVLRFSEGTIGFTSYCKLSFPSMATHVSQLK